MIGSRHRSDGLGQAVRQLLSKNEKRRPAAVTVLALTSFLALVSFLVLPMVAAGPVVETYPEPPAISVDLQGTEKVGTDHVFTNPFLPPLTTSRDHRIGLVRKAHEGNAIFHLIAPEQMSAPLFEAGNGATMLAPATLDQEVDTGQLFGGDGKIMHFMMCDPQEDLSANPPIVSNPVICEDAEAGTTGPTDTGPQDCYNLWVMGGVVLEATSEVQLFSTPVRVKVEYPKEFDLGNTAGSREAKIIGIEVNPSGMGGPMVGPLLGGLADPDPTSDDIGIPTFHTPMLSGKDQSLLLVRFGVGSFISWDEAAGSNSNHTGSYDPVYAVAPENSSNHPCDPNNWTNFKPLSFAPQDSELDAVDDFDFAKQDFRQPDGQLINPIGTLPEDVKDIPGRYVWMDQDAKNVFFGSLSRPLLDRSTACQTNPAVCEPIYPVACVPGSDCTDANDIDSEEKAAHQGWMMMGAWTHGKMVLLDSQVNHTDFGLRLEEEHHRMVELYNDPAGGGSGTPVEAQVGSGRDDLKFTGSPYGYIDTTVQFGSMENFLNLHPKTFPRTPRDVVWQISAISRSDEIAFDDLTSQRMLIFSPMNAVKDMRKGVGTDYYDGVDNSEMRLQNAATSTFWTTPSYGAVETSMASRGRIEHVASGGIKGRGFYLYNDARITYDINNPLNVVMDEREWLVSIFIDPRNVPSQVRRLITLPSGAYIDLHGVRKIKVCGTTGSCPSIFLAKRMYEGSWSHLAFHIKPGLLGSNPEVDLYQDGFLFERLNTNTAGFGISNGDLIVGSSELRNGAEGWIDELKVVEGPFSPEEICNHARGTLVAVPHDFLTSAPTCPAGEICLDELLSPFENETLGREAVHKALHGPDAVLGATTDHYICHIDYGSHLGVSLADPGDSLARSLRRRLLFPEGPIHWDESRPASVSNNFCLSCHGSSPVPGLELAALTLDLTKVAESDPRRQPMQAPKFMPGQIPANYFGEFKPLTSRDGGTESIDRYINDGALFRWTFDEAAGTKASNWVLGRPSQSDGDATLMDDASFTDGVAKNGATARGHGIDLDGDGDYVKVDDAFDIKDGELTLSGWFKSETPELNPMDFSCQPFTNGKEPCTLIAKSGAGSFSLWSMAVFHNGTDWQVEFEVSTSSSGPSQSLTPVLDVDLQTAGVQFDDAEWHHLAGVYSADDGVMEVYLDGELLASQVVSNIPLVMSEAHGVTIGSKLKGEVPIHYFKGQLDDIQVFSRRLWDWEVKEIYETTP